jgi:large subunit ribosomal protein L26e
MKYDPSVSSSSRKQRKAYFTADSTTKRKLMSSHLSKELREKYNVRAIPVKKGDEVTISRGKFKGRSGAVVAVYRLKNVVHVERITREKANKQPVPVGLAASNLIITKLKVDAFRKKILDKKAAGRSKSNSMAQVD